MQQTLKAPLHSEVNWEITHPERVGLDNAGQGADSAPGREDFFLPSTMEGSQHKIFKGLLSSAACQASL